jgi:Ca-activated chloride channel family protein
MRVTDARVRKRPILVLLGMKRAQDARPARLLALAALLVTGEARAQVPRFAARTELVTLSATAVDSEGRPVQDLKPAELRIFEDGRPQPLQHFSSSRDSRARILLLMDASGSMNGELKATSTRMAAVQILASLQAEDEAALAAFDNKYWGVVRFTTDRDQIVKAMDEIEPYGSTALHDALEHAARDLASHGEGRRAIVVITDGVDTSSQRRPDEVIATSRALDVPIYTLAVLSPLDDPSSSRFSGKERPAAATAGSEVLARYAGLSGGAAFAVSDFTALKKAADRIASELKFQYRLGYDPPPGPPRFRRVEVRATRKGVVVRTRSGYVPQS